MSSANDLAKTFKEVVGIKGRFLLFALGIAGLFFPGLVTYAIMSAVATRLKDVDVCAMIEELEQD